MPFERWAAEQGLSWFLRVTVNLLEMEVASSGTVCSKADIFFDCYLM
jgi:hypothetical protein